MLNVTHISTYGWEAAIRGMRNPLNSWHLTDTKFDMETGKIALLGAKDLKLMKTLAQAGHDHGKFLRMIGISCDICAPLYWWKEFDTYKVGTVANSCSTMHKIHSKEFTLEDFSTDHLMNGPKSILRDVVVMLNECREKFNETKEKRWWWQMVQLLPSSYNQLRTVTLNYEVARGMYDARHAHKLDEWHILCDTFMNELPYFKEICYEPVE